MSSENDTDTPADRQSRIDRALSVPAEQPGKPENWRKRLYAHADKLAEALMQIDEQISDVNQMLHRTQGPRTGKISVRFLCLQRLDRNMDNRDRIPVAVSWYGPKGQAAKRYKMLPRGEKYFSLRRRGENDEATRQLLRMLQELLEQRAKVEACHVRLAAATAQLSASTLRMCGRMEETLGTISDQLIERDFSIAVSSDA